MVIQCHVSEIWGWNQLWQENDFSIHFDPNDITLVHKGRELVGYSHVENQGSQLFIRMLIVHPHHQRKGIGKKLLEAVIISGKENSKKIGLEVFKINSDARKYYEIQGFNVEDETSSSYVMKLIPTSPLKPIKNLGDINV
ncbi:MAG: GNAT family N-acetyltransferase [Gammaproteobacteria bacterium]